MITRTRTTACTPEGLYLIGTSHVMSAALFRELTLFYRAHGVLEPEQKKAVHTCRQPLLAYINHRITPLLYTLFTQPQVSYNDLMQSLVQVTKRKTRDGGSQCLENRRNCSSAAWGHRQQDTVDRFCESVEECVGQRIRFCPFPAGR